MNENQSVLFEATPKQLEFFEHVFDPENTFIAYGGSAGGGKSLGSLAVFVLLCKIYPFSRWCVIRKSLTEIKLNTIPSFWKVCPANFVDNFNKSEFIVTFKNGSQIIFRGENIDADPELQWMDGLEVNGFILEQAEELNRKTYDKCKLRAGRWVITPMPPIKILLTLNPSMSWTKQEIYLPYTNNTLAKPYCYIPAKMTDNPYLPKEYIDNLKYLDSVTYRRFVDGDWSAFAVNNPYAYEFKETKHISPTYIEYDDSEYLNLSFDFNVDPATCIASQYINDEIRILRQFKLENSNVYDLCDRINVCYPTALFIVTGDCNGYSRSAISKGNTNAYIIIKEKLNILDTQIKTPHVNPGRKDARVLVNSLLQHFKILINAGDEGADGLIDDLRYTEVDENGFVDKTKYEMHLLDCFIYLLNTFHRGLLKTNYEEAA